MAKRKDTQELARPDVLFNMHNNQVVSGIDAALHGQTEDLDALLEYLAINRVILGDGAFVLAISRLDAPAAVEAFGEFPAANGEFARQLEEYLLKKVIFYMAALQGYVVCILAMPNCLNKPEKAQENRTRLIRACEDAASGFSAQYQIPVLTVISPVFQRAENLPGSYRRTMDMMAFRRFFGEKDGVFIHGVLPTVPQWRLYRLGEIDARCRSLTNLLLSSDKAACDARLSELLELFRKNVPGSLAQYQAVCFQHISMLLSYMADQRILERDALARLDLYGLIDLCEDKEILRERLLTLLWTLTQAERERRTNALRIPAEKMKAYIQTHFADPNLTVTALAEQFQMSQPAFSAYYKRQLGISPLEELNRCRVLQICSLLESGAADLEILMERAGFCSLSTMNRLFKKYVGTTIAQYRQKQSARGAAPSI